MYDAFIFDMDGTLIDTEIVWVEAVELLLTGYGIPLSREEALEIVYGVSWPDVYTMIIERFPRIDMTNDEISAALRPIFVELRDRRDVRIPSSIALLKRLSKDYPVCIVSGSAADDVAGGIALMGIEPYLRFWLSEADYSPGKPHPACYRMAAEKLGLPPEACVVFEDSRVGVRAAKAAGMACVALARNGRPPQDFSEAGLVLDDLGRFSPDMLAARESEA